MTLDRYFAITARGSTVARAVRGAFATFLTMAYILFVNPPAAFAAYFVFEGWEPK